jgi:cytochrome c-type biogenesis protein
MSILWKLVSLAAADSVNPCTFYVFATLLLAVSMRSLSRPRRAMAVVAAAFILGVYTGYYILGLGIAVAGTLIPKVALLGVALAYGGIVMANAVSELVRGRPLTPKPGRLLSGRAVRAADAVAAASLGLTLSFTLLPCSGGPLLAFIATAISAGLSAYRIALLLLAYDTIFVLPLIAVAAAFTLTGSLVSRKIPPKLHAILELAAGILVVAVVLLATA